MKKILVVDDAVDIVEIIEMILDLEGYEVHSIYHGYQLTEEVKNCEPDLILLDIMLGNQDGRELCKMLKSGFDTKHIPIIMISATHDIGTLAAKSCPADDFIAKPFDIDCLIKKVGHYFAA